MRTNHQRGFVEKVTRYVGSHRNGSRTPPNHECIGTVTGADGALIGTFLCGEGLRSFGDKTKVGDTIIIVGTSAGIHDTTNGKHGVAKNIRGAKKFVRSRIRFKANQATRKLKDTSNDEFEG